MTLDEAIKHAEEVAEKKEYIAETVEGFDEYTREECLECASEHRQLAEWLRELVHLRNITAYLRDFIDCFGSMDSMYYNEDIIEWAEEELRVEMRSGEMSNMTCKEMNEWAKTFMDGFIEGMEDAE